MTLRYKDAKNSSMPKWMIDIHVGRHVVLISTDNCDGLDICREEYLQEPLCSNNGL